MDEVPAELVSATAPLCRFHLYACERMCPCACARVRARERACMRMHMRPCADTPMRTCARVRDCMHIHLLASARMRVCVRALLASAGSNLDLHLL